jgi:hypothetical protein
LSENLKLLIGYRERAKNEPAPYKFKRPGSKIQETDIIGAVSHGEFVDKTASYVKAIDPKEQKVNSQTACFARRMGKSTWLEFLKASLGVPGNITPYEYFYTKVAGLERGKDFIEAPLRPVFLVKLYHCETTNMISQYIVEELCHLGIKINENESFEPAELLNSAIFMVQRLFEDAIKRLDDNVSSQVSSLPLVLIDEYDAPWRKKEIAAFHQKNATKEAQRQVWSLREDKAEALTHCVASICDTLKARLPSIFGVAIVSLVPLGGTGLSKLDTSTNLGAHEEHHTLFGISQTELKKILGDAEQNDELNWGKVYSWAESLKIVMPRDSEEEKRKGFFQYLEKTINGFCSAFLEKTGAPLDPLYSPLDILQIITDIIEQKHLKFPNYTRPKLLWLKQAADAFCELIQSTGNYDEAVEAFLGGSVVSSEIDTVANMTDSFETRRDMLQLLFHLGLLRVGNVTGTTVSLFPVLEGQANEVLTILTQAYQSKVPKLTDEKVNEYRSNHVRLAKDMTATFRAAAAALKSQYASMQRDVMREEAVQDRLYQMLNAYFINPMIHLAKEMMSPETSHCLDMFLAIRGAELGATANYGRSRNSRFESGEAQLLPPEFFDCFLHGIILEIKVDRDDKSKNYMLDALKQAHDYRSRMGAEPDKVWLMGVVCRWEGNHLCLTYCYGKFEAEPTQQSLKRGGVTQVVSTRARSGAKSSA